MTALEAYKNFLLKINKNDTNRNVRIAKGNFVLIYNEQAELFIEKEIENRNKSSEKNYIQDILVHDTELSEVRKADKYTEFDLPEDFFEYESSYSIASKGLCNDRKLYNWDFKSKNKNTIFQDENNNPSFDYEETIINLSEGKLIVFKDDFEVDKQFLTYYRKPKEIDIEGYIKIDGTPSKNINPDISDRLVKKIIDLCALEVIRSYENPEGVTLAKDRINSNN